MCRSAGGSEKDSPRRDRTVSRPHFSVPDPRCGAFGVTACPAASSLGAVASQESSFDIVSKLDRQEVDNALNQAAKEIGTRFDFRGVGASIAWSGEHAVDIRANSEERAKAVLDVFKDKLVKRGV